jgi:tetratricopeptide (TPR) repeat protein
VPIEGPLRELSIHDVFQLLDLAQKTGVLRVTSELRQNGGTVYFDQGAVVAAEIQSNPHPLGSVLLRSGKVSESDLARARDMQASGDSRRLGEILIAVGAVPRKELERQVRAQVEEVIFELMGWSEGYFSFSESPLEHVPAQASLRIPTGALLMEAARRIDEWSRIESMVPHLGVVPRLVAPDGLEAAPMDLLPGEWQVLAAVDGARDVRVLADAVGRSDFDVARTLYGLASAGIVVIDDPRSPALPASVGGEIAELLARAEAYLIAGNADAALGAAEEASASAGPDHLPSRLMAARALLAAGRPGEAQPVLEAVLAADALHAPARRLLGLALAAQGRFDDAVDTWDAWSRIDSRPPEEDTLGGWVSRLRSAAELLGRAARASHE